MQDICVIFYHKSRRNGLIFGIAVTLHLFEAL
jgi:hypothetical protein